MVGSSGPHLFDADRDSGYLPGHGIKVTTNQRLTMDIADWRRKIDEIDQKLVDMLNQRAEAAQEIGRLKRVAEMPIYEPDRERIVLTHVQEMNRGPLLHRHLLQIYERIMDVMRNIQKDQIVGENGSAQAGEPPRNSDVSD